MKPIGLTRAIVLVCTGCNAAVGLDALVFEGETAGPTATSAGTGGSPESASSSSAGGAGGMMGQGAGGSGVGGQAGSGGTVITYADVVMSDSPVAYWRLGEASGVNAIDSSGNAHNGLYVAGPTLGAAGAIAGDTAVSFDGVDDKVSMGDIFDFASGASFSLEAWVRPFALPIGTAEFGICGKRGDDLNGGQGYILRIRTDGAPEIRVYQNSLEDAAHPTVALPLNVYSYVVGTFDGTTLEIYVNGVLGDANVTPFVVVNHPQEFSISHDEGTDYMLGDIDEVAVYNYRLDPARIAAHYAAGQ